MDSVVHLGGSECVDEPRCASVCDAGYGKVG